MLILILIGLLAVSGIVAEDIHKKARPILKEEGYKLIFYIRYSDIKKFLNDDNISNSKKEKIKKLVKMWLYITICSVVIFILFIFIALFFPSAGLI